MPEYECAAPFLADEQSLVLVKERPKLDNVEPHPRCHVIADLLSADCAKACSCDVSEDSSCGRGVTRRWHGTHGQPFLRLFDRRRCQGSLVEQHTSCLRREDSQLFLALF